MHVHASAMFGLTVFLSVLVLGTMWRLIALRLVASSHPTLTKIGKAMAVQY